MKTILKHFEKNTQGSDYVIGDVHGCFSALKHYLDYEIGFDYSKDRLFLTGDIVDRGMESELCFKWLGQPWLHCVRGNHEDMLIRAHYGDEHDRYLAEYNGGQWFTQLDKQTQACYVAMFEDLPLAIEIETDKGLVGIVHADVFADNWESYNELDSSERRYDEIIQHTLWSRVRAALIAEGYVWCNRIENINHVYCGHTPFKHITTTGSITYMDTGFVFGGMMQHVKL